jgi:pyruvate/2-oxoglutarate dehydrogenase complex dihydrolipoamide dehydrogenase (E3) component
MKRISGQYDRIALNTKVIAVMSLSEKELTVSFLGPKGEWAAAFDRVLCAVGRIPYGARVGAETAGMSVHARLHCCR